MRAQKPGQSTLLILDVIDILNNLSIPYAVIGALAASFYGTIRASMDADALISLENNKGSADSLIRKLKENKLIVQKRTGDINDPIQCVINIQDSYNNQVDLLIGIRGMSQDAFKRLNACSFKDSEIRIISVEDFIAMKIFAGSPKDINDASGALQISKEQIDFSLLNKLTENYGNEYSEKLKTLL